MTVPSAPPAKPVRTTRSLAEVVGAELVGNGDLVIRSLDTIERSGPDMMTFVRTPKYADGWAAGKAGAALLSREVPIPEFDHASRAILLVPDADLALITILGLFAPESFVPPSIPATTWIDATAKVAPTARVGMGCVVGPRSVISDGVVLHGGVYIGADVSIGPGTVLHPHVRVLDRCSVGAQSILWPGVTLGADGFGFRPAPGGRGVIKVPHIGSVEVGNGVEIGANSCVDRGKFGATVIGDGTKIDNLVQIGHNARIGRAVIICGGCAIAGSVVLEDGVMLAGQVGVADNLTVGARAIISAQSGVMHSVPAGAVYFGTPANLHHKQMRLLASLRNLPEALKTIKHLEALARERFPEEFAEEPKS